MECNEGFDQVGHDLVGNNQSDNTGIRSTSDILTIVPSTTTRVLDTDCESQRDILCQHHNNYELIHTPTFHGICVHGVDLLDSCEVCCSNQDPVKLDVYLYTECYQEYLVLSKTLDMEDFCDMEFPMENSYCNGMNSDLSFGTFEHYIFKVQSFFSAIINGNEEAVSNFLTRCIQPNIYYNGQSSKDKLHNGDCGLHVATRLRKCSIIGILCSSGAFIDRRNANGETALHIACTLGYIDCIQMLLLFNADVDAVDENGNTALILAFANQDTTKPMVKLKLLCIAKLLLNAGANPNSVNSCNDAALHFAAAKRDPRFVLMLLHHGANITGYMEKSPLIVAMENQLWETADLIIQHGCDVNAVYQRFPARHSVITPLKVAIQLNKIGLMLDLLKKGATVTGKLSEYALFACTQRNRLFMLLILLCSGADVNTIDSIDGTSLLLAATKLHSMFLVRFLLQRGADPNRDNALGTTPVWASARMNAVGMVKLFLRYNCDIDIASLEYYTYRPITALQVAFEVGHFEVAELLLQAGCHLNPAWLFKQVPPMLRNNPLKLLKFQKWLQEPQSLKFLTRKCLRNKLGTKLPFIMRYVGVPTLLRKYVLCIS